jgi:hypothetical protein
MSRALLEEVRSCRGIPAIAWRAKRFVFNALLHNESLRALVLMALPA